MNSTLSIIIPAFDEQARLGETIKKILNFVQRENLATELIVVDDGSNDATLEVAKKNLAEFPRIKTNVIRYEENRGKGYAVRKGLLASTGDIAIFSDADLSTPIEELPKLVEPIRRGKFDVTFGSRALDRSLIGTRQTRRREQGGKVFNLIVRIITGLPFWDTQCGFKAFNMRKFRPLLDVMTVERFGFDVEFLYVANYRGLRLKEIPVRWNHCDGTKVSVLRDSVRMFSEVRQIRKNAKKGIYDKQNQPL
ncbi:MAG: glycosyltransferase family 2 protein [Acidobacteria bacterium]|nr:glycosyltransferase family 2 protein [Acidobacteriota bacterium]